MSENTEDKLCPTCGECLEYARGRSAFFASRVVVDDILCEAIGEYVTAEMEACEGFKAGDER